MTERRRQQAQAWELALWRDNEGWGGRAGLRGPAKRLICGRARDLQSRFDDWNHWWPLQFEVIPGADLSNAADVRNITCDTGRPIRLRLEDMEPYLVEYAALIHEVMPRESCRSAPRNYAALIFAGRRRGWARIPDAM